MADDSERDPGHDHDHDHNHDYDHEPEPELREVGRWEGGVSWMAYPDELIERASHALAVDGEVWVVDPLDAPDLDDLLAEFGEVAGVVVCLDRHKRDADAVARRHDVPVHVPTWMTGVDDELDAPTERFGRELADAGIRTVRIRESSLPPWQEVGLYREADGTLVVPEAVGAAPYYLVGDERLGVHPMLRPFPPRRALGDLSPDRVLVGHGEGVLDGGAAALEDALSGSRRRAPALYAKTLRMFLS